MTEEVIGLLHKAERSVTAAATLLQAGDTDFAASRSYNAMFYTAEAVLLSPGFSFRKHTGVQAPFGKHFAKGRELDPEHHRWLLEAFAARIAGDYRVDVVRCHHKVVKRQPASLRLRRGNVHLPSCRCISQYAPP